ncbi:AMP-binding protein [Bacillus sonorensis]|nr:AMP-binding protein [Bacillus sonorensis]
MFEEQAERTPEKTAVVCGAARLTYRELNNRANHLAYMLRENGVKPDTTVALMADRSPLVIVSILGILKAGARMSRLTRPTRKNVFNLSSKTAKQTS